MRDLCGRPAIQSSRGAAKSGRQVHAARGHRWTVAAVLAAVSGLAVVVPLQASAAPAIAGAAWRSTEILPPLNARTSPVASLDAVACAGTGSCAAGGSYESKSAAFNAMVVAESKGRWARAQELRLPLNAFAANPVAQVNSMACTGAGSCAAVGSYVYDRADNQHGFTAVESKGMWARARQVTLPANAATHGSTALLAGVTCTGPGSCLAVGDYLDNAGGFELMVVAESNGHWSRAREIAPPRNAASNPQTALDGVACWGVGACSAVGGYMDASSHIQALAVTESGGHWGRATEIAVPSNAGANPGALLAGVACSPPGACTAVGGYFDKTAAGHAMAVNKSRSGWARATEIRPPPAKGFEAAGLDAVSCIGAGTCEAVGSYILNVAAVPMAVTKMSGRWTPATNVAPPANALTGMFRDATLLSVACIKGHACTAVGWYVDKSTRQQAMAATRSAP